ncbi:hypothetical protein AGLY_001584 [Aphis glycines]|uniref:Carboxylesterase type B domain-containing protein n=1 Tax=Aphis glycines TaxID=307491 RepID=A0A6G0U5K6_APHGL|nr:hypothetical protein AGLY_001584 [Aphis glycines]
MVPPWWLLVAFVFGGVSAALTSSRVVRTKYGDVSGVIVTPDNRRLDAVEVFRGVPSASPPVGSLRFMPPVTGSLWSGVKVADRFGPVCPQRLPNVSNDTAALKTMARGRLQYLRRLLPHLQNQSEDCLYLNIYAPAQGKCVHPVRTRHIQLHKILSSEYLNNDFQICKWIKCFFGSSYLPPDKVSDGFYDL